MDRQATVEKGDMSVIHLNSLCCEKKGWPALSALNLFLL